MVLEQDTKIIAFGKTVIISTDITGDYNLTITAKNIIITACIINLLEGNLKLFASENIHTHATN